MRILIACSMILMALALQAQNVGIGTTSPLSRLHIRAVNYGFLHSDLSDNVQIGTFVNTSGGWLGTRSNHPLYLFTNNGSAQVTLQQNGNLGIGVATAAYLLDVNGRMRLRNNGVTPGLWLNKADNTEGAFIGMINDSTTGFWGNGTVGSYKVAIDVKNGQMGIGTTDPAAPLAFANVAGNKVALWSNANGTQYGLGLQGGLMQLYSDASTSDIAFGYGSSTDFTERMRIKGNGNVGIGTNNPSSVLTVQSNAIGITQQSNDATTKIGFYTSSGAAYLQTHSNHDMQFSTNNSPSQMTLKTNGNLGIGTGNPQRKLEVNGTVRITGGSPAAGRVLTSTDAFGSAIWQDGQFPSTERFLLVGSSYTPFGGTFGNPPDRANFISARYNTSSATLDFANDLITINKTGLYHLTFTVNSSSPSAYTASAGIYNTTLTSEVLAASTAWPSPGGGNRNFLTFTVERYFEAGNIFSIYLSSIPTSGSTVTYFESYLYCHLIAE